LIDDALKYISNPPLAQNTKVTRKRQLKFSKVKDIYFPPKVGKALEEESKVFGSVYVSQTKVTNFEDLFNKDKGAYLPSYGIEGDLDKNKIGATMYAFKDSVAFFE